MIRECVFWGFLELFLLSRFMILAGFFFWSEQYHCLKLFFPAVTKFTTCSLLYLFD